MAFYYQQKRFNPLHYCIAAFLAAVLLTAFWPSQQPDPSLPKKENKVTGLVTAKPVDSDSNTKGKRKAPDSNSFQLQDSNKYQPTESEKEAILKQIMPMGMPEKYGKDLNVSFDLPIEMINKLSLLDGGWSKTDGAINFSDLSLSDQNRYLNIGMKISCEFCCIARSLIKPDGEAICSCVHSAAMRGLAKYLLKNYGNQYTDEQILNELAKVKTISFPKQMAKRALLTISNGGTIDDNSLNLPLQVGEC